MQLLFKDIDEPGLNTLPVYRRRGGWEQAERALDMDPSGVLEELQKSGIRGRGGAGFAMGTKAGFLPKGDMDKYLVCNADESEPGTFKDRELMQKNPHLLLEGIVIAAHAVGPTTRSSTSAASTTTSPTSSTRAGRGKAAGPDRRTSTSGCTAAPAPTSAARRRRCWTRWRASAATRA